MLPTTAAIALGLVTATAAVTDCTLKVYAPDGKSRDVNSKAGSANAVPTTQSHHAENVGASDCQVVFVERK